MNGKPLVAQLALFDKSGDRKYFTIVPNITWEKDLSASDFKLYSTIKKVAGPNGTCYMSTKRLAQEAGISMGSVSSSKQNLKDEGLITITRRKRSTSGQAIDHITIVDIWEENILHFVKPSSTEGKPSPNEHKPSPNETEEEPFNKNQEEEMPKSITEHFEDVIEYLRTSPGGPKAFIAATAEFCALCFGGKPEYGRVGRIAKKHRDQYRRICQVALECVARSPRGDPYSYLEACLKGEHDKERQTLHSGRGPRHHVADRQEFEQARRDAQERNAADTGG